MQVTTGTQNTLVGGLAGDALTTGTDNVAIGYAALSAEDAHGLNVAIGSQALRVQNAGANAYNVGIGYNAGGSISTGVNNTLLGGVAGDALTTGTDNIAIGFTALSTDTEGNKTTAIGRTALLSQNFTTSTDSYNVAVGYDAGRNVTTGTQNTYIGGLAGDTVTTGTNNTLVGYNVDCQNSVNAIGIGHGFDSASDFFKFGKASNVVSNNFTANATFSRSSDQRWKKDITTNTDCGLDFIKALRTVTYKWKAPSELDASLSEYNSEKTSADFTTKMYGFIAQEVKQAMDDNSVTDFAGWVVDETSEDNKQGVSYEMFVVPLVKAIQELEARVAALES